MASRPMRARGLKPAEAFYKYADGNVAPHAGAWIETDVVNGSTVDNVVAPHAGAWIETLMASLMQMVNIVAPHAGAWIETCHCPVSPSCADGRAPCGRVD